MRTAKIYPLALLALLIVACGAPPDFQRRLKDLESAHSSLALTVSSAESRLSSLESRVDSLFSNEGQIDPTSKAFSVVKTNNGHLLVSAEDVTPYGDGQKVTLRVGNPYGMSFSGFKMTARYGPRAPEIPASSDAKALRKWFSDHEEWERSLRSKELSFTDELRPGRWNRVAMILAPATAHEVGTILIKIMTDQISLLAPLR